MVFCSQSSTRGKNREWVWERIEPKRGERLPPALVLLSSPSPAQLEIADASVPMSIDPAVLVHLDDPGSNTGQVQGSNRDHQDQSLQRIRCSQLAALELEATRFRIEKSGFDVKTQAVLLQGPGIGWFIASDVPGVIRLVKQAGQSQVDWPYGCS